MLSTNLQGKKVSNWLMVETMRLLKEKEMEPEDIRFAPEHLSRLIALVDGKVINSSVAKEVFQVMFECRAESRTDSVMAVTGC